MIRLELHCRVGAKEIGFMQAERHSPVSLPVEYKVWFVTENGPALEIPAVVSKEDYERLIQGQRLAFIIQEVE